MNYKLYLPQGILECYVYSVKNSEIEKQLNQKAESERLGIIINRDDEERIYGEPVKIVIDLNSNGGISFFTRNRVELYEKDNFVDAVYVEFKNDLDFVLLINFKEFKKLYFEYKGINNGI